MLLGLFVICISYAVLGAWIFILLEEPNEIGLHELKKVRTWLKLIFDYKTQGSIKEVYATTFTSSTLMLIILGKEQRCR